MTDDANKPLLSAAQLEAIQAMAASGMSRVKIAEALMVPEDLVEVTGEWHVGRIEALRVGELEAELFPPVAKYTGSARKRAFLAAFEANGGNRTAAADAVGIERSRFYQWLEEDPEFVAAFQQSLQRAADVLEDEVTRRAKSGVLEPIYNRAGNLIGHKLRFSDQLLLAKLAAERPEKWKPKVSTEITGKDGGPVTVVISPDDAKL